ncbi:SurA N-terminal domain-containing protein [Comamonas sp. Y33R10-2]|uniref:SurA N-terminal domain-containing protein n=1 Tax=Comamonas sp. Y33R10-2 TaxID=2853257 RepID=UPI001C5CBAE8|nr:SurA N-terminal domain-containing protein [Comamonas sp. Y33R10-2]QXZ10495.1 SurA N-terminal domain-containing protein [Comamonas sp. Y33R10-2]
MFESIRKHSKFIMILLFLLIIPSFIFVGVDQSYFTESSQTVARVDGHEISQQDWDNAHRAESDRLRAQNPTMDAKLLDTPEARYNTLEKLVRDRVLAAAANKMHLTTSDAQLVRTLREIPAIATLQKPDGSLDAEAYKALVGSQGMTPEGFEANLRRELALAQVLGTASSSSFATGVQLQQAMNALYQRREIQVARFDAAAFAAKVQPTEAELKAFYEAHTAQFKQAEAATVEYLQLDLAAVQQSIVLSEDDLRTYYKENAARLAGTEERRASHILINASKDMPAAERAKSKAKAEELLAQVRKDPKSFAQVAKANSQDPGSAANGGDLGYFGRDAMVKPFEEAVFKMKEGDISDVIESDFGFHIIELTAVKQPKVPSFEEMRPKLEADLKQQQAQRKFAEAAEAFTNGVYEQSESLKPVAEKFKLTIHKAENVTREPVQGAQGPLASKRFLEALFSADSLENKRNTDAVELAPNTLVAGRVLSYSPAHTQSMEEVGDKLKQLYVAHQSAEMAKQDAKEKMSEWKAKPETAKLAAPVEVGRDQAMDLPREVLDAALRAPTNALPAWEGVDLGNAGYAVIKINRVAERPAQDAQVIEQQKSQFTQWASMAEVMAYYEQLKKDFKVQIKVPRP